MANKKIKIQLSLDEELVQLIDEYADKYNNSRSGIVSIALRDMDDAKRHPYDYNSLTKSILDAQQTALQKQKQMIESELKYLRAGINGMGEHNFLYSHVLNSILWKMNCTERDFQDQTKNQNPVITLSFERASDQIKALRQKKLSADKKYQDKAMSNGNK
jgi:hypothetical protein